MPSPPVTTTAPERQESASSMQVLSPQEAPSLLSTSGISSWARSLKILQPSRHEDSEPGSAGKSMFARFTSGFGLNFSPRAGAAEESGDGSSAAAAQQSGVFGLFAKGLVDSSKSAVKAVQVKARHIVSQNKRRYQC